MTDLPVMPDAPTPHPPERPRRFKSADDFDAYVAERRQTLQEEHPEGFHGDLSPVPPPTERLRFERLTYDNWTLVAAAFEDDPDKYLDHRFKKPDLYREYVAFLMEDAPWSPKHGAVDYVAYLRDGPDAGAVVGVFHAYDLSRERWMDYPYRSTVGFAVARAHRRRGYAREGFGATLRHARDYLGRTRFLATVAHGNAASIALLEQFGFTDVTEDYGRGERPPRERYFTYRLGTPRSGIDVGDLPEAWRGDVLAVPEDIDALAALGASLAQLERAIGQIHPERYRTSLKDGSDVETRLAVAIADERRTGLAVELSARGRALPDALGEDERRLELGDSYREPEGEDAVTPLVRYRMEPSKLLAQLSRLRATTIDVLRAVREEDLDCGDAGAGIFPPRLWGFRAAGRTYRLARTVEDNLEELSRSPYLRADDPPTGNLPTDDSPADDSAPEDD